MFGNVYARASPAGGINVPEHTEGSYGAVDSARRNPMDAKRRAVLMVAIFLGLLAFHGWLLYRVARAGNTVLAVLLAIAVGLFAWRIAHYAGRYRNGERAATVAQERRRDRKSVV